MAPFLLRVSSVVSLSVLCACSQNPAPVALRGSNLYDASGRDVVKIMPNGYATAFTANSGVDSTGAPISQETNQSAGVGAISSSELDPLSANTVVDSSIASVEPASPTIGRMDADAPIQVSDTPSQDLPPSPTAFLASAPAAQAAPMATAPASVTSASLQATPTYAVSAYDQEMAAAAAASIIPASISAPAVAAPVVASAPAVAPAATMVSASEPVMTAATTAALAAPVAAHTLTAPAKATEATVQTASAAPVAVYKPSANLPKGAKVPFFRPPAKPMAQELVNPSEADVATEEMPFAVAGGEAVADSAAVAAEGAGMTVATAAPVAPHLMAPVPAVAAPKAVKTVAKAPITEKKAVEKKPALAATPQKLVAPRADEPVIAAAPKTAAGGAVAHEIKQASASRNASGFIWPVKGKVISGFGEKANGESNDGINIAASEGAPVAAAAEGEVVYSGNELPGYGNMVILRHKNGMMTAYAHTRRIMVNKGDKVKQGQMIAEVGKTGEVNSPQLHFGIRKMKEAVDPSTYLSDSSLALR